MIVRPGVVFGPGEDGNVTRLIKAVTHLYFFYMANKETRKAGVYIKELCHAMWWVLQSQNTNGECVSLFNMSMNPAPFIKNYVDVVCKISGFERHPPSVPYFLLLLISNLIDLVSKPFGIKSLFSPVRIKKLVHSNHIVPNYLIKKTTHICTRLKQLLRIGKRIVQKIGDKGEIMQTHSKSIHTANCE